LPAGKAVTKSSIAVFSYKTSKEKISMKSAQIRGLLPAKTYTRATLMLLLAIPVFLFAMFISGDSARAGAQGQQAAISGEWVAEVSAEQDLEHSLSPGFPRAFLRKGQSGLAAIAAPPDGMDPASILSFGLIWLDYLRRRERPWFRTASGMLKRLPG